MAASGNARQRVVRFRSATDSSITIDTGEKSLPIDLDELRPDGVSASEPVAIQFLVTTTLAGNIEVAIDDGVIDLDNDAAWSDADGGDLSQWASGGSAVLVAPFTHIRLNVSGGDTQAIIRV